MSMEEVLWDSLLARLLNSSMESEDKGCVPYLLEDRKYDSTRTSGSK